MGQFEKNIYSIKELDRVIQTEDGIVIYGAGDYGKKLIDYLFYIKENKRIKGIIVTNRGGVEPDYKGIKIWEAGDFFAKDCECHLIIAVSGVYQEEIVKIVQQYGRQYRSMTYDLYSDIDKKMDPRYVPYHGIDFLCPGFGKCGTSSLYSAFKMLDGIYLPERKENHFFEWCDDVEGAEKILIENFYDNIKEGQKVGMIDPTYAYIPKRVHDFVGNNVKIIFLVRNPVEAAFSGFKMAARIGGDELYGSYSKWDGLFSIEMFDEYLEKDAISYKFIDWIEQFERYYAKEKIKIVFLEELIKKPQVLINDLLDFIGISERYEYEELPLKHQGNFVMADEEGYNAARIRREFFHADLGLRLQEVRRRKYEKESEKSEIRERCNQAHKVYDIKITMGQKRKTEEYFNSSVRRLEAWLNRDLSEIWF